MHHPPLHPRRHSRLLLSLLLLSSISVGCVAPQQTPASATPLETRTFRDAQKLWVDGNFEQSKAAFETFLSRHSQSSYAGEALIYLGRCEARDRDWSAAHARFLQASRSGDRRVVARAQLELGDLRSIQEEYSAAATRYAQAAHVAIDTETRQEALLRQGIALQRSGKFQQARQLFERLLAQRPSPSIASRARQQLEHEPFFRVRVGIFRKVGNAETQAASLRRGGIDSELKATQHVTYGRCTAVISGRFQSRAEAEAHRLKIQQTLGGERPVILP